MSKLQACLMAVLLLAMALPALAQGDSWADRVSIDGYFQVRYEDFDYEDDVGTTAAGSAEVTEWNDGFTLPRLHINLRADVDERTTAVVSWTRLGGGSLDYHYWASDWTNMYLDYAASDDWTIRVGQAPNCFGLEGAQDSSERMSFERAAFLSRIPNLKPKGEPVELKMDWRSGLYYAGRWDRGVWVHPSSQECRWASGDPGPNQR